MQKALVVTWQGARFAGAFLFVASIAWLAFTAFVLAVTLPFLLFVLMLGGYR